MPADLVRLQLVLLLRRRGHLFTTQLPAMAMVMTRMRLGAHLTLVSTPAVPPARLLLESTIMEAVRLPLPSWVLLTLTSMMMVLVPR